MSLEQDMAELRRALRDLGAVILEAWRPALEWLAAKISR